MSPTSVFRFALVLESPGANLQELGELEKPQGVPRGGGVHHDARERGHPVAGSDSENPPPDPPPGPQPPPNPHLDSIG